MLVFCESLFQKLGHSLSLRLFFFLNDYLSCPRLLPTRPFISDLMCDVVCRVGVGVVWVLR